MRAPLAAALLLALAAPAYADSYNGGGSGGAAAGVDSISTACPASAGQPLTGAVTLTAGVATYAKTGTSYTIGASEDDCGALVTFSNTAAQAVTLPQAGTTAGSSNFQAGFFVTVSNINSGIVTITPTTSTINGAATLVLYPGQSVGIVSDGTNYQIAPGSFRPERGPPIMVGPEYLYGGSINLWFAPHWNTGNSSAGSSAYDVTRTYWVPFYISSPETIEALGVVISTGITSTDTLYMAIYSGAGSNKPVGSALATACINNGSTAGGCTNASVGAQTASLIGGNLAITRAGWYWFGFQTNDTAVRLRIPVGITSAWIGASSAAIAIGNAVPQTGGYTTGTTAGTWPTDPAWSADIVAAPFVPAFAYEVLSAP